MRNELDELAGRISGLTFSNVGWNGNRRASGIPIQTFPREGTDQLGDKSVLPVPLPSARRAGPCNLGSVSAKWTRSCHFLPFTNPESRAPNPRFSNPQLANLYTFLHHPPIEEMDGAIRVPGVTGVMGYHADGGASSVKVAQ